MDCGNEVEFVQRKASRCSVGCIVGLNSVSDLSLSFNSVLIGRFEVAWEILNVRNSNSPVQYSRVIRWKEYR